MNDKENEFELEIDDDDSDDEYFDIWSAINESNGYWNGNGMSDGWN